MRHYGREYLGHWVLALLLAGAAPLPVDPGAGSALHLLLLRVPSLGRLQPRSFGPEPLGF